MLTWYWLIMLKSRIAASRPPWCDAGWKPLFVPLSGYARLDASRPVLNENTRVMSDWNASTWKSNISFMCSANESGTPIGASGSSRASPLELRASTAWMRRSSSRMSSRYLSSALLVRGAELALQSLRSRR